MKKSLKLFSVFCLMALLIISGCTNSTKMYFVNFNTFDGSDVPQLKVTENQNLVLPNDPTKTGYEFDGWYLDFNLTKKLTLPYKVTSNITLYAKWNKIHSDKVIDIRIDDSLVKKEYNALETFDKTNLKVTKVFEFGDTETAKDSEISIDKTVLHGDDTKVTVTCSNISKEIKIKVNKLDYVLPNFASQTKEYNGKVQNYDLTLISNLPETLEVIVKSNGITFGESSVTLSFKNLNTKDYNTPNDVMGIKFKVTPKVLDEKMFDEIPSVLHTGVEQKPLVNGTFNGVTLVLNQDYTVNYLNNINVGTGKVVITGTGKFSGEVTKTFEIVETDIEKVLSASLYLENKYGLIFNGVVSSLPNSVDVINSNNSTNYWISSTTALFVDELGNLSVTLKDEEQIVDLVVMVRSNDAINYVSFTFTLPKTVTKVDSTTKVEVKNLQEEVRLNVKEITESEKSNIVITNEEKLVSGFNISLYNGNELTQPLSNVEVRIPIPNGYNEKSDLNVYYVNENGDLVNMNAEAENGYLVFTTNHFSTYIITTSNEIVKGSIDNPYTVIEATEVIENGGTTIEVYVKGTVTSIEELSISFGNATFYLDGLKCFRLKYLENTKFSKENDLLVGDSVVVCGILTTYNEIKEISNGYVYSVSNLPREEFNVSVEESEYGNPTLSSNKLEKGLSVTLTFNPKEGYEVSNIKVNETLKEVSGTSINLVITEETVIIVNYKEKVSSTTDITFDFTSQGYSNQQAIETIKISDVTITFNKGTNNNNPPKYFTSGDAIRTYGGNYFTITSEKNVVKVILTFSTGENNNEITVSSGSFNTDTWTGNDKSIIFTISGTSGQRRIKSIVVTISSDDTIVNPTNYQVSFDSDGGSEVTSKEVKSGESVTKPTDPIKDGYNFMSWQLDGIDYDFTKPVTKNITLKATWESVDKIDILYELVTTVTQLQVGSKIIIVHKENDKNRALGIVQRTNNREATEINFFDDLIMYNSNIAVIEVCKGNVDNTFALKVTNGTSTGYLYAAGNSKNNYLKTETTLSNNSSWTITIDENGNATIIAQGNNTNNVMRYNASSDIFACYAQDKAGNQKDIQLYIKTDKVLTDEQIVKKEIELFKINPSLSNGYSLPLGAKLGSKITWKIDDNHTSSLQEGNLVNDTTENIDVTIYAKFTYGEYTSNEIAYNVTIRKTITSTDVDKYYDGILETSGEALKNELRELLTETHTKVTSYDDCKTYLQEADEDPNNQNNMILFYTGTSVTKTANMSIWNREHVWCQSLGWFKEEGAGADLHHIRPCNPSVNTSRNDKKFGVSNGYYTPSDEYKGDVARIIFYLMVRYSEADNYDFTAIVESLDILLEWNELDPVSENEINRNNYIYTIQGNRNPFIDNSNYANLIWG